MTISKKWRKPCIYGLAFVLFLLISVPLIFLAVHQPHSIPAELVDPADTSTDVKPDYEYAAAPANHPPSVIVVGPYHWRVRYVDFRGDYYGRSSYSELEIYIDPSLPLDQLKETVLHEVMHACLFVGNSGSSPGRLISDDGFIESSVPTLLGVMEQNPELVHWLTQKNF